MQALLRYRSKTAKMQKLPIDSHSNKNFISPLFRPPGAANPQKGRRHIRNQSTPPCKIWCGSVHALLRYRSKTAKMQKLPIDSYSNDNFISPFFHPPGAATPKRGENRSGTRVRPHAKFRVNRPAGCRENVDKKANKKTNIQ